MISRIEALALAIAHENQSLEPGSEAFLTLNPGLLRGYSLDRLTAVNDDGTRVFGSFQGGYRALIANLEAKCSGKTRAKGENNSKLSPDSTLKDLVKTFRYVQVNKVVGFLQDALNNRNIIETTKLSFFIEG